MSRANLAGARMVSDQSEQVQQNKFLKHESKLSGRENLFQGLWKGNHNHFVRRSLLDDRQQFFKF